MKKIISLIIIAGFVFLGTSQVSAETSGYHSTGEVGFFGSYETGSPGTTDTSNDFTQTQNNQQKNQSIQSVGAKLLPKMSDEKNSFAILGLLLLIIFLWLLLMKKRRKEE
ncbi:LPXTG cell wall anchor domain-containing protein [Enterococcus xiangfangensis]|uniref:LPXTG cell wall anchor domain-containing protein n=1 Tax=Enterococcus xiangfangensis TaxID=1296537 RepID=A0ABU3FDJ8_9ENTE|nr:LPXTG cell wall anchor domain-containing protein [Enterococcus xiangfangensis]MDT2760461.1 LPXTG cell wall anchor domain-containing protein [Enterococcus xiangfangensis]NBK08794.1 LPXTG cell wall anchor domain-containing protein [Enterococcus asini]